MARKRSRINQRKKRETARKYNMLVPERNPFEESDIQYYKRLAKRADDRLRALEKLDKEHLPDFENILQFAYASAMYDTHHFTGTARFSQNIPLVKDKETGEMRVNYMELNRRTNAVLRFLQSPTSTKTGTIRVYKQRAKTLNARMKSELGYDPGFTWQELARFYEHNKAKADNEQYGSDTVVKALGAIRRVANKPEMIKDAAAGNIKLANDKKTNEAVMELLQDDRIKELFDIE